VPRSRNEYLEVRKVREQFLKEESDAHDRAVLQLSAATIGVSVVFLDKIAKHPPVCLWLIIFAWFVLTVSLTSLICSYYVSQAKIRNEIRNLDAEQRGVAPIPTDPVLTFRDQQFRIKAGVLNRVSGICLIVGFVCILAFAGVNLCQRSLSNENQKTPMKGETTMPDAKSPPPPPPQPQQPPPQTPVPLPNESYDSEGPPPPPQPPPPNRR
jgi:hypothetical protein